MLEELRRLRESDALSLTEKAQEVERLAGEIEVLRGVVEEGLNERRQGRGADQSDDLVAPRAVDPDPPVVRSPESSVRRFIDDEELDRISVDHDERRSERKPALIAVCSFVSCVTRRRLRCEIAAAIRLVVDHHADAVTSGRR